MLADSTCTGNLPGGAGQYEAGDGPYYYGNLFFGGRGNFAEFWTSTEEDEYNVHNVMVASNRYMEVFDTICVKFARRQFYIPL